MKFCYSRPAFAAIAMFLFLSLNFNAGAQRNQAQPATDLLRQTSEVNDLMVRYDADQGSLERFYFIPHSPERAGRLISLNRQYLQELKGLPFARLSEDGQVDYILFQRNLDNEIRLLRKDSLLFEAIHPLIPFADSIYQLEKIRRRGHHLDAALLAGRIHNWCTLVQKAIGETQGEQLNNQLARQGQGTVKGLQTAMKSVLDFYNGYDPDFTWWIPAAYKNLDSLLGKLEQAFEQQATRSAAPDDGSGIRGNPIGREELIRQLNFEMIPYSPEEILELANREFAWCDKEMLKASREMGFGDNWKAALEKVKNSYVPPGRQPDMILDLYQQSIDFIKQHDLVSIPPLAEETWRMRMMSPRQQLVSPFFLGGEVLQISYPTDAMEEDDKLMSMRGNNPHFSRATVHHELIAGHHLQMFMNSRNKRYRNFYTPFWIEGWSLYWEFILWDMGFPRSPEDRVGMLFWRMHRCARILFSLNYHLGKWTPQQCIDFLVDRVGHERANAEGEVRRSFTGGYGPLYQIAYMLGGQQFYALKKELVDSGKMTYKAFHDAVLRENSMPVEMVRALLTHQPLTRDFKTQWRFYPGL